MIEKIISGGQTGVDSAALDMAIALGIQYGGFCPAGRINENGKIPDTYKNLEEVSFDRPYSEKENYEARTKKNIASADGTFILVQYPIPDKMKEGTALTIEAAGSTGLVINLSDPERDNIEKIATWVKEKGIRILNIGGPRESSYPGIYQKSVSLLKSVLPRIALRGR
jgi:hypothetical protein